MVNRIQRARNPLSPGAAFCAMVGDTRPASGRDSQRAMQTNPQEYPNALRRGYLLEEYRIESPIGGGGFSLVYLAFHVPTQARVVIKEYYPAELVQRLPGGRVQPLDEDKAGAYQGGIRRFFNEGSALAKVNHPNIVHVRSFFRANNTVYMVMDHEEGSDLRAYIKRHGGGLSEKFLRAIFPQLLQGLTRLHGAQLLHLDIKPANIWLCPGGRPLLLDFGAVQHAVAGLRRDRVQTLTLGFAPIEQHEGGEMGPWTDLYALGASMYACITGRAPPPATERAVKDKFTPISRTHALRYSKQLLRAIDWSLSVDARARPQNAEEMLQALSEETDARAPRPLSRLKLPWAKEDLP